MLRSVIPLLVLLVAATCILPTPVAGQGSRLPATVEAGLILRQLDGVKRVLMVAAHPDDEDTALLAYLARGLGADVAYFSFTRGEGGQNRIGPELGEGLGIIRSGELLAAREIDGAKQFFGRAYDFGYSKTAAETLSKWPREIVLGDLVYAIRLFRPQVLVSLFGGTERDGHGHHQVSGILSHEAWDAAGDPTRFPEQLRDGIEPWAPLKLYTRTFFGPTAEGIELDTGELDPLLGLSYHQVAMSSRSQHRSQDFGTVITPGPRSTSLVPLASRTEGEIDPAIFAGIDTTLASLTTALGMEAAEAREGYRTALARAGSELRATQPEAAFPALAEAKAHLQTLMELVPPIGGPEGSELSQGSELSEILEVRRELGRRSDLLSRALLAVAGVRVEARARDDILVPGQEVVVETRVWSGRHATVLLDPPSVEVPEGWGVEGLAPGERDQPDDLGPFARFFQREGPGLPPGQPATVAPNEIAHWRYSVAVPTDAEPTTPYFLKVPRNQDIYEWPQDRDAHILPFVRPPITSRTGMELQIDGVAATVEVTDEVRYRGVNGATGEFWHPLLVAPSVSVTPLANPVVWPVHSPEARELAFIVSSNDPEPVSHRLILDLPEGWRALPSAIDVDLSGPEDEQEVRFTLEAPSDGDEGEFFVQPRLVSPEGMEDVRPGVWATLIDYSHIERRLLTRSPAVKVLRADLRVAERSTGYVMGSGDEGPEAIRQLGLDVELIGPGDWQASTLDKYDTIVLGVRAYEARDDLKAANRMLLEWVERGGTLVVQYNRYEFSEADYAPFPITIERPAPRVTDETTVISIIDDTTPLTTAPNRIEAKDFEGWAQERGLYFPSTWDPTYKTPFEMADPGEEPQLGSLLVAPSGEGVYVYTSLSLFRQWRAGVPGALRLWANLLSIDGETWTPRIAS